MIEFDSAKSTKNERERGIGFERFADMDLEAAISLEDTRKDYGEKRLRVLGTIDGKLHAAVVTPRGETIRVISCGGRTRERKEHMRKNASRPDVENPEWTAEDIRRARPLMDVLPKETVEAVRRYRGQRGPQKGPTKELISLRVDRDVVAAYRATGAGWQKRASEALRLYARKSGLTDQGGTTRRGATRTGQSRHRRAASR